MSARERTDKQARSLLEFAHAERQAERRQKCPICRLPDPIKEGLRTAREKGIERRLVMKWLRDEMKAEISELDLQGHYAGHHEERDRQAP